jgi:hypothetical protein
MDSQAALWALHELSVAAPMLDPWTVANRCTAILDRAELKPLDLVTFLEEERDIHGAQLARLVDPFARKVKSLYVAQWGVNPLKKLEVIDGKQRRVNAYLEEDRALFERAYRDVTGQTLTGEAFEAAG